MKPKIASYLLAGGVIVLAAWLVHAPRQAQADVPEKYHDMLRKGLEYLAKQQHADGHWEGDGGQHPVAMTGLVGLALLMATEHPRHDGGERPLPKPKHRTEILKATNWLLAQSQAERDGLLFSGHASETTRYMEGHGLATLFLSGVLEDEIDNLLRKPLTEVLTRAVKYIGKAPSSRGGWYHTSKVEGHDFDDVLVTAIQLQALQAADHAGIGISGQCIDDGREYLKTMLAKPEKAKTADVAAALAACHSRRFTSTSRSKTKHVDPLPWLKICQTALPRGPQVQFGRDELSHYYYAQALFCLSGEDWSDYRTALFDHLQKKQNADGSWPAATGLGVGPVYATALWCTLLQLDRHSHPLIRLELLEVT
jgi:hypothetical protein